METILISEYDTQEEVTSDDALIQQILQQPTRFSPLYRRYAARVYRYLYGCLWNIQDAQDLTSQVFLEVLQALPRYRAQGNFTAWLFTIVRRRAIDFRRNQKPVVSIDAVSEHASFSVDPLEEIIWGETLQQLGDLFRKLDDDSQELLRLRYGARLSYGQIGQVLGRSEAAVGMALTRLLGKLKAQWEGKDD